MPCAIPTQTSFDVSVIVRWRSNRDSWWAPVGHLVAWDEIVLNTSCQTNIDPELTTDTLRDGLLTSDVLLSAPKLKLWRASTDNDGFKLMPELSIRHGIGGQALSQWLEAGLDTEDHNHVVNHRVECVDDKHTARYSHFINVPQPLDDLGRIGVIFNVPARFDQLRWYGRGPHENYPDRNRSAMLAIWETPIDECPYLVPQEFGLRTDCRWFELVDAKTGEKVRIDATYISHAPLPRRTVRCYDRL